MNSFYALFFVSMIVNIFCQPPASDFLKRLRRDASQGRKPGPHPPVPRYMLRLYEERRQSQDDPCAHPIVYNLGNIGGQDNCNTLFLMFNISSVEEMHEIGAARLHLELHGGDEDAASSGKLRLRLYRPRDVISNVLPSKVYSTGKTSNNGHLIHSKTLTAGAARDLVLDITRVAKSARESDQSWLVLTLVIESSQSTCNWLNRFAFMLEVEIAGPSCVGGSYDSQRKKRAADESSVSNMCRRKDFNVNFDEIGWGEWVVAPPSYNAYICEGTCPFPVNDNLNATNHAILQNLLHFHKPDQIGPACCVPTALSPISMLYYDFNDNLVLRVYDDMMVIGCGCQ